MKHQTLSSKLQGNFKPQASKIGAWSLKFGPWAAAALLLGSCSQKEEGRILTDLRCYPSSIELTGKGSRQSIVIQAEYSDGTTRDVTTDARTRIADTRFARLSLMSSPETPGTNAGSAKHTVRGLAIAPLANGRTVLLATFGEHTLKAPVKVLNATGERPTSFKLDVMPVFIKGRLQRGFMPWNIAGQRRIPPFIIRI